MNVAASSSRLNSVPRAGGLRIWSTAYPIPASASGAALRYLCISLGTSCTFERRRTPARSTASLDTLPLRSVDEKRCGRLEERAQDPFRFQRKPYVLKCRAHQFHPAVACALIDRKRSVAHAQARMAALLQIARRPAESNHQKVSQVLLGFRKIAASVHRPQQVVRRNLFIERTHQALKAFLADQSVDVVFLRLRPNRHFLTIAQTAAALKDKAFMIF